MLGLFFCLIYLLLLSLGVGVFNWSLLVCGLMFLRFLFLFKLPLGVRVILNYGLYLDLLRGVLVCLSMWVSALIILSRQKIYINKDGVVSFLFLVLVLCFILVLSFLVGNMVFFYVFFEASLLPTFLLILG